MFEDRESKGAQGRRKAYFLENKCSSRKSIERRQLEVKDLAEFREAFKQPLGRWEVMRLESMEVLQVFELASALFLEFKEMRLH